MAATAGSLQDSITDSIAEHFRRSCETLDRAASDGAMMQAMIRATEAMAAALRSGNKILVAGNGGSAADAQHIAGEFLSRLNFDRNPLPAIALTTDTSVLTAIGNDYGFEHVFERQVRGLAHKGDVLLAISTSGRSPNILAGLRAARAAFSAARMLGDAPEVEIAMNTSPARPRPRTWRSKAFSNP